MSTVRRGFGVRSVVSVVAVSISIAISIAVLVAQPPSTGRRGPASSSEPPRLILVLSIDQLSLDLLTRRAPLFTGGLQRLLSDGALFTQAMYGHAITETAPGHSVILSGRHPRETGIISNDWYDRDSGHMVNAVDDPRERAVGGVGRAASPRRFIGATLGDVLKGASPRSKVVGVSAKDRAAILLAGPRADGAFWFEGGAGGFVTSSYYGPQLPVWLERWNARHLSDSYSSHPWTRLRAPEWYQTHAGPDSGAGEPGGRAGRFPHDLPSPARNRAFYDALIRTPAGDALTLSVALQALEVYEMGLDASPDILAVGFSSTDFIGHTFGPDSQEMLDQLLRLDEAIGRLLADVDRRIGRGRAVVVLTADHGAVPLVERLKAKQPAARRASPAALRAAVEQALARRYPSAGKLLVSMTPGVYLDRSVMGLARIDRAEAEKTVADALMATGIVTGVYGRDILSMPARETPADEFVPLYRNSYVPERSPDLLIRVSPYTYLTQSDSGTGHGTAYEYDRHVPVLFMGPGIVPGRYASPAGPEDIAPTLASMLGLPLAPASDGRLLTEMTRSRSTPIP